MGRAPPPPQNKIDSIKIYTHTYIPYNDLIQHTYSNHIQIA